jgi:hypothetical protein
MAHAGQWTGSDWIDLQETNLHNAEFLLSSHDNDTSGDVCIIYGTM